MEKMETKSKEFRDSKYSKPGNFGVVKITELHHFFDASEKGYD